MGALLLATPLLGSDQLEEVRRDAASFGRSQNQVALSAIGDFETSDFGSSEEFDGEVAKRKILSGEVEASHGREYYRTSVHLDRNEMLFEQSEQFSQGNLPRSVDQGIVYQERKCRESGSSYLAHAERRLEEKTVRICLTHKDHEIHGNRRRARRRVETLSLELKKDPNISESSVKYGRRGCHSADIWIEFTHVDDCDECESATSQSTGESEWIDSGPALQLLIDNPKCSLVQQEALGEKRRRYSFLCQHDSINECAQLPLDRCQLLSKRCLSSTIDGCMLWENRFKCFARLAGSENGTAGMSEIYGSNRELEMEEEPKESSYTQVVTNLAVFAEVEKELESTGMNADDVGLFGGRSRKCNRAVIENVLYDCCHSMGGLATKVKLAKCNAEERELSDLVGQGRCHYVGSRDHKILGVKSSKDHVYCCFSSKLSRVVQEEARKQLGIGWGKAKNPKCQGLTAQQIAKIDFSQMNLSELYEEQLKRSNVNIDDKLSYFQKRLLEVEERL